MLPDKTNHMMRVHMQHSFACQAEVAPRGVPMTGHIVLSILIGACTYTYCNYIPHTHHVTFPEVAGTTSHIYM